MNGITPLPQLGIIRVAGAEAAKFLQGQLTQDVQLMGLSEVRRAAWCSAKGRMLASFIVLKPSHDEILLICSTDLLSATLKRLSMFVMRAKCVLSDVSGDFHLCGLAGSALIDLLQNTPEKIANYDGLTMTLVKNAHNTLVVMPFDAASTQNTSYFPRALWLAPVLQALPDAPVLSLEDWNWLDVMAGVATISAPIADAFVPQMLNYESVGGVNFKKGCYPGQEVVARSQFRGTLKRRAFVVHSRSQIETGQEVYLSNAADQPCGMVAQQSPNPSGGYSAIVSLQISAVEAAKSGAASLQLGSPNGAALVLAELPYSLLADV